MTVHFKPACGGERGVGGGERFQGQAQCIDRLLSSGTQNRKSVRDDVMTGGDLDVQQAKKAFAGVPVKHAAHV